LKEILDKRRAELPSLAFPEEIQKPCVSFSQFLETSKSDSLIHISLVFKRHLRTSMQTTREETKHPLASVRYVWFDDYVVINKMQKKILIARV